MNARQATDLDTRDALISMLHTALGASSSSEGLFPGAVCLLAQGTCFHVCALCASMQHLHIQTSIRNAFATIRTYFHTGLSQTISAKGLSAKTLNTAVSMLPQLVAGGIPHQRDVRYVILGGKNPSHRKHTRSLAVTQRCMLCQFPKQVACVLPWANERT